MNDRSAEYPRRPYTKPRIRTIELVAEEVLTTGCKNGAAGPARSPATDPCGLSQRCAALGS
jgi:hypothetical protein